jgi:uncharacterized membrane-anchored protein
MEVDLVLAPEDYGTARPRFDAVMRGFHFKQGNQYADFVKGDKIAAVGLSALVLGGAGAVALKTGLLAKSWKLIVGLLIALKKLVVIVILAIGAALKKLWARFRSVVAPKDEVAGAPPPDGTGGP